MYSSAVKSPWLMRMSHCAATAGLACSATPAPDAPAPLAPYGPLPTGGTARPITRWGAEVMHRPQQPVTVYDDALRALAADMVATMVAADGVIRHGASGPFLLTKYLFHRRVSPHRPSITGRRTGPEMIDFTGQTAIVTGAGR